MRVLYISSILAFAVDQLSKWAVTGPLGMEYGDRLEILPPVLVFVLGRNDGINFGLFSDSPEIMRYVLIAIAIIVSAWLIWWSNRTLSRFVTLSGAGLIIGGALANAYDRVMHGAVIDFLNMSCCGISNPYIFNIADIAIFAGAFALIAFDDHKTP